MIDVGLFTHFRSIISTPLERRRSCGCRIASLSEDELRSVMTSVLNHVPALPPAGSHPVMTGSEWGYPELEHDTPSCMKLLLEGISWSLSGFFGEGQSREEKADPAATAP